MTTYKTTDNGIIQSPGKFEGELAYVPYFWEATLEGMSNETIDDDGISVEIFIIDEDDRGEFPVLLANVYAVALYERSDGFVCCSELSESGLDAFRAACSPDDEDRGPQEGDLVTSDHRVFNVCGMNRLAFEVMETRNGMYRPYSGKYGDLGEYSTLERAIRGYMKADQYWPNCWFVSDHGNAHLMDLERA